MLKNSCCSGGLRETQLRQQLILSTDVAAYLKPRPSSGALSVEIKSASLQQKDWFPLLLTKSVDTCHHRSVNIYYHIKFLLLFFLSIFQFQTDVALTLAFCWRKLSS